MDQTFSTLDDVFSSLAKGEPGLTFDEVAGALLQAREKVGVAGRARLVQRKAGVELIAGRARVLLPSATAVEWVAELRRPQVPVAPNERRTKLPVISLFSGGLGLDLGLEGAGLDLRVAVECNRWAARTIRLNRPDVPVIERRIEDVTTAEILRVAGLKKGDAFVVAGGPSCQTFSTAGQRASLQDPRGSAVHEFLRVVREARPRFFVMENVRGVLSAAVRHRPLGKRGPGFKELDPDERLGSALLLILRELKRTGYYTVFDLVNAADFGAGQARERVVFIGSRDGEPVDIPPRTHACAGAAGKLPWLTLRQAIKDIPPEVHTYTELCRSKKQLLKKIPEGGNWRDLSKRLQESALGAAYQSWGGRSGFFRRLKWDSPAPSLTSRPDSKATMLCHPSELRPLSVQEYARLQMFPSDWRFAGGVPQQYLQIGNAVPVGLGKALGDLLVSVTRKRRRVTGGVVRCADPDLLRRLAERPSTVLNPGRMRRVKGQKAAKRWLKGRRRDELLDLVVDEVPWI